MSEGVHASIAIIGGTGIYDVGMLEDAREVKVYTPYGDTSDMITVGKYAGKSIAFLPRHGKEHRIPPHRIPARANIWALKQIGVRRIIAPAAVGSMRDGIGPGDIVIPDQFIDFTKRREYTFYDGGEVCHVSLADPFCPELRRIAVEQCKALNLGVHERGTYICIEGPRYSTRAESLFFRDMMKADVIGMTLVPECVLAREMEICYLSIATVTDYDVWAEKPVSTQEVIDTLRKNSANVKRLLREVIPRIPDERKCACKDALKDAMI
ncbi:MAG: S-methyl-5'-thioadenosine phosphorylase [Candidatus Nitrosocaldus sp.]|nr:S-methyl-5'-thioadenosine phosphorylase [Candidatus Nitrosocaldus sp.]MDW8275358.1 S-methyl-5'-thioadenosine phosphorylase [Candidatus Nitrosocaldus sp.]